MSKLTKSAILIFASVTSCIGQDLGILSTTLYQKSSNNWTPTYKSEYTKESLVETTNRYRWENNAWHKVSEETRYYSANGDTVLLESVQWETDIVVKTYKRVCYYVRDRENSIIDLFVDGKSKMASRAYMGQEINFDINEPCLPTNYPFDEAFREAEILKKEGTPLEGKTFVIDWCVYFEFIASCDEFNRIKSLESETRKIVVTYRNNSNLVPGFENIYKIYPNPFHDDLAIDLLDTNMEKIEIQNSLGMKVYEVLLDGSTKVNLKLSNIPAGLYWINLFKRRNVYSKKFLPLSASPPTIPRTGCS